MYEGGRERTAEWDEFEQWPLSLNLSYSILASICSYWPVFRNYFFCYAMSWIKSQWKMTPQSCCTTSEVLSGPCGLDWLPSSVTSAQLRWFAHLSLERLRSFLTRLQNLWQRVTKWEDLLWATLVPEVLFIFFTIDNVSDSHLTLFYWFIWFCGSKSKRYKKPVDVKTST